MHPSTIPSELTISGLRAPQSSPMRVPRGTTRPNSDDNSDDDDVRLTRSQSRASASVESGYQPNPNPDRGRDGPSSSSQPKAADTSVPAVAVGATAAGTPNVPFGVSLTL